MATKTFDFGSDGVVLYTAGTESISNISSSTFNSKLSSGQRYLRGVYVKLSSAFGTDSVTINSVKFHCKAYGEKTSSIYNKGTLYFLYFDGDGNSQTAKGYDESIGRGSGNNTTFDYTLPWDNSWNRYSNTYGENVILISLGIYNPNSLTTDTYHISEVSFTVDYTPIWEYKVLSETDKTCYITKYNGSDTNVTVPSTLDGYTVVRLGYRFYGSLSDTADFDSDGNVSITKDTSITGSGYYSTFAENTSIQTVNIPSSVRWIGYQTFRNCTSLKTINWTPSDKCVIGRTCFYNCTNLVNFTIPENVIEIYGYTFQNCTSLTRLDFKNKYVAFKNYASDSAVPSTTFQGTSDSLIIGCYHQTDESYSTTFGSKTRYYFDAMVSFVSDNSTVKSGYVDIGTKPTAPNISKDGFTLSGWSDGTTVYSTDNLPDVKSDSSGAVDVTYTAVWEETVIPPEFTSASLTYADAQVSASNKVPASEHCILSVGVS
ncbi:MAG: leucine-rich repeat domain-containing protein [Acutalibacteraceae bacterium]